MGTARTTCRIHALTRDPLDRLIKDLGVAMGTDAATGLHSNQTLDFKIKGLITRPGSKHKGFSRKNAEISDIITAYYAQDIALFESASLKFKQ